MSDKSDLDLNLLEQAGKFLLDSLGEIIPGIPSFRCTEPDYPASAVLLDVPGLCQVSTYTCGITSSWSILTALGYGIQLKKWFAKCHKAGCHPDEGMDIDQLRKALKSIKASATTRRYTGKKQIQKLIDGGQPILFGQGGEMFEDGDHWMYIYGYSPRYVFVGNVVNPAFPIASKEAWGWAHFEEDLNPNELYIINA